MERQEEIVLSRAYQVIEQPPLRIYIVAKLPPVAAANALREALRMSRPNGTGLVLQITGPVDQRRLLAAVLSMPDAHGLAMVAPPDVHASLLGLCSELAQCGHSIGLFSLPDLTGALSYALREVQLLASEAQACRWSRTAATRCRSTRRRSGDAPRPPAHRIASQG